MKFSCVIVLAVKTRRRCACVAAGVILAASLSGCITGPVDYGARKFPKPLVLPFGIITGNSMAPTLRNGDLFEIREEITFAELRAGMLVVRNVFGVSTLHRLTGRNAAGLWITRGDANGQDDPPMREKDFVAVAAVVP